MNKSYIEIKYEGKVIAICPIKESTTADYLKAKKQAEINFINLLNEYIDAHNHLVDRITDLEKEVKHLKGED